MHSSHLKLASSQLKQMLYADLVTKMLQGVLFIKKNLMVKCDFSNVVARQKKCLFTKVKMLARHAHLCFACGCVGVDRDRGCDVQLPHSVYKINIKTSSNELLSIWMSGLFWSEAQKKCFKEKINKQGIKSLINGSPSCRQNHNCTMVIPTCQLKTTCKQTVGKAKRIGQHNFL